MNLYTWHMSHATYRFLLFALTWYLITTNGQSIPRDTRTVFSLPLVIVSLRIGHWCFIFRWTCSPNVNTKQLLGQVWQCHVYVANNFPKQQWSPQWRRQGTHVGSTWSHWPVTNQHVRARPGAMTSMGERKSKGCASVPKPFYFLKWIYKVVVNF